MQDSKVRTSVQAVHCTTPGGTFLHEYGNPASIEPEVRQDMEQMVSDDERGRLMKGVQEKQKSAGAAVAEPVDGERATKYVGLA